MRKAKTAKDRVRQALLTGPKTTAELCQPDVGGIRFSARLEELAEDGFHWTKKPHGPNSWTYIHIGDPAGDTETRQPKPPADRGAPGADYHCCDDCGYRFKTPTRPLPWPQGCPSCHAEIHWISSFYTRWACEEHVPLRQAEDLERRKNLKAAA